MTRRGTKVELSAYLADQERKALKGLVSAPIAYRIARFIEVLREARVLGNVDPAELIAALVHAQRPDLDQLRTMIEEYREARVWQTRESLGEITKERGPWWIRLPGRGERWG